MRIESLIRRLEAIRSRHGNVAVMLTVGDDLMPFCVHAEADDAEGHYVQIDGTGDEDDGEADPAEFVPTTGLAWVGERSE